MDGSEEDCKNQENSGKINICSVNSLRRISQGCLAQIEALIDEKEWDESRKREMKLRLNEVNGIFRRHTKSSPNQLVDSPLVCLRIANW